MVRAPARSSVFGICFVYALCAASASRVIEDEQVEAVRSPEEAKEPLPKASAEGALVKGHVAASAKKSASVTSANKSASVKKHTAAEPAPKEVNTTTGDPAARAEPAQRPPVEGGPQVPSNYWVFVRTVPILPVPGVQLLGAHTELALCLKRGGGEDDIEEDPEEIQRIIIAGNCGMGCSLSRAKLAELAKYLPECWVISFTSDQGIIAQSNHQGPDEQFVYGFSQNAVTLTWAGRVTGLNLQVFIDSMMKCGNWMAFEYGFFTNNCNMFTTAALKGMGILNGRNLLSAVETPFLAELGYFHAREKKCMGQKCLRYGDGNACTQIRNWESANSSVVTL